MHPLFTQLTIAQAANGLLLPVVAAALLLALNNRANLGSYVNGWLGNAAGLGIVVLCGLLTLRTLLNLRG